MFILFITIIATRENRTSEPVWWSNGGVSRINQYTGFIIKMLVNDNETQLIVLEIVKALRDVLIACV